MRKRLGEKDRYVVWWLDEKKVVQRLAECRDLSRSIERIACSLDAAERALSSPAPHVPAVLQAVEDVRKSAVVVKEKHWIPEDRSAYNVEKGARDLAQRLKKAGTLDAKAAGKLKSTLKGLREKAALLDDRLPNTCGLRTFEGIVKPPKE